MVHITTHSGKMLGIQSISTNNLSNDFCIRMSSLDNTICSKCYANRLSQFRPSLVKHLQKNSELLSIKILESDEIPTINALYFRFNSFGELINEIHYRNLVNITKHNSKCTFTLWTKRVDIILNTDIIKPKNMILIYSNPILNYDHIPILPKGFDKVFSIYSKKFVKDNEIFINCEQNCLKCLKCYTKNKITHIYEELK